MDTVAMETAPAAPQMDGAPEIEAPALHPRVADLVRLELAKLKRREELVEIEKQCEAAAEPFALEIERIEARLTQASAEGLVVCGRRESLVAARARHLEAMDLLRASRAAEDAEFAAVAKRIEDDSVEAEHAIAATEKEEGELRDALNAERDKFDAARTTSAGRSIEHAIVKIERQQEKIVARNPGAMFYRAEMAISAAAERLGYGDKLRAVGGAMQDPAFGQALNLAIRAMRGEKKREPTDFEVRLAVVDIIKDGGVETEDVDIHVVYRPPNISVQARGLSRDARNRCLAALMAGQSLQEQGSAEATA